MLQQFKKHQISLNWQLEDNEIMKQIFIDLFVTTNSELNQKLGTITELSGSTGVSVLAMNDFFYCANVGDSMAGIASLTPNGWTMVHLSNEHHPHLPEENHRIITAGGRVEPFRSSFYSKNFYL